MQYANNFNPVIQEAFFIVYSNTSLYFQFFQWQNFKTYHLHLTCGECSADGGWGKLNCIFTCRVIKDIL